ncbi:MAG: response regulator transcription factor [Clostridia bacterium]|nr:response regulator transcription factor [Clostridia bacterium]
MIRIGICDDSRAFLQQTKFIIDHWKDPLQPITCELFENGDELITAHSKMPFDILLLDVVMPLLNGIETARELRQYDKNVKIVFLTSSAEYAVDSYTVKASNYLMKPFEPSSLFNCLNELISEIRSVSRCLTVKGLDATHRIPLHSIEYVESQGKHIVFYTTDNRIVESIEPLYAYEKTLSIEDGFFKCHRSYIVNIHHISSYSHSEIVMHSGYRIPISRSHRKTFDDIYFDVVFEKAGDDI